MRLLELDVKNVRGVRQLQLRPDGRNFAIWGPNGSGKSAVVDAIDFLLTGRVTRLMGKGTGELSLKEHGPHIDHEPKEAVVRAVVQLPGENESVEMRRCMANPRTLVYDESKKPLLEPVLALASRGQHVLTRREILKYVTEEPSNRAEQIQELLDISEIEDIRKTLVSLQTGFSRDLQAAQRGVETAKGHINATAQRQKYDERAVLDLVNENRRVLRGGPTAALRARQNSKLDSRGPQPRREREP